MALGLAAACGGDAAPAEPAAAPSSVATEPTTTTAASGPETTPDLPVTLVDDTGAKVTIESVERIIPLDGDIAEVVFALGLGDNVVATDISATYPPEADALPEIGYQRALSAEPIAAFEPTVAIATDLAGPPETIDALRALHIPLVVVAQTDGPSWPASKIRAVAAALGVPGRGEALAGDAEAAIAAATVERPLDDRPRVATLYLRGESVQLVLGAGSGADWVIHAAGGIDIGTELGIEGNAPLSTEAIVAAAPDVFVVSTSGLESVGGIDGFLAIPGIAETPAGAQRRVIAHPDQFLFGNGPRTGDLIATLADELVP